MSAKVKISYEKPQELKRVLELLQPIIKTDKAPKDNSGRYKKHYIELKL